MQAMNMKIFSLLGAVLSASVLPAAMQAPAAVTLDHVRGRAATVSFADLNAETTNSLVIAWGGNGAAGDAPEDWPNVVWGGLVRPGDGTRTVTLPDTFGGNVRVRAFLVEGVWNAPADYVRDGLVTQWDGLDNAGTGAHDPASPIWKDKAGSLDLVLTPNGSWNAAGNGLLANGLSATGTVATVAYKTIEALVRRGPDTRGNIVFASGSGAAGNSARLLSNMGSSVQFAANDYMPVVPFRPDAVVSCAATYAGNSVEAVFQEGSRPRHALVHNETWGRGDMPMAAIGGRNLTEKSDYPWRNGEVFTVRLYDRVLADEELAANYRLDAVRYLGVPAGSAVLAASDVQVCAKGVSVVSQGTDLQGRPVNVTLAFRGVSSPCDLVMAWGSSDAGADPASWPNRLDLGVVEPEDETRVVDLPAGWGGASAAHARFFLRAGVDAPADYVGNGLVTWLDGIDNAGTGVHDPSATVWKDKAGTLDFVFTNNPSWNPAGNALRVAGASAVSVKPVSAYRTVEAMYRSTTSSGRCVFFSNCRDYTGDCRHFVIDGGWSSFTYFDAVYGQPGRYLSYPYDSRRIRSVAATYNASWRTDALFLGGNELPSAGYYNNWGNGQLTVGVIGSRGPSWNGASDYPWTGELYTLRLYSRVLTPAELRANHRLDLVRYRGAVRDATVAAASADVTYAAGLAGTAAAEASSVVAEKGGLRVDLRDGVRVIEWRKELLPFVYSDNGFGDFTAEYVQDGLVHWWDGIDNVGLVRHDPTATVWKDKKGSMDMTLMSKGSWNATRNGLHVDNGCAARGAMGMAPYTSIEIAYKMTTNGRILFNSGCTNDIAGGNTPRLVVFDHDKDGAGSSRGYFDGTTNTVFTAFANGKNRLCTLTGVYSGNTVADIYGDGVRDTAGKTHKNTWGAGDRRLMVGERSASGGTYPWSGEVYAIRLYNRALTSAEVARNHALDLYRFSADGATARDTIPADLFSARITLVQVTGEGADVSKWTQEVPGTATTLNQDAGEGEIEWFAKPGVWKASFELVYDGQVFHVERAVFDLRDLHASGCAIVIR